ncbi:winged helix-turn-helix domain-containing protein [Phycicoccus flavus]|uniref:winged helix-turn-helix domain-containing protein n=1 Tax=Phycicoccus flavus TaxID=2502783 RepID=UPI000FEB9930|nr:winged helix-turn-helix domain-containing protein [Phycicoccus flavus]NHA67426.1 winged helix-turn-helix transcriptional regulator [Phycicoccus flavus]
MSAPGSPDDGHLTGLRLDAVALKTLAHPLRSRLLSSLRVDGPATATDLAARLRTNSGATSYHLRRLESVGLVADTGDGEGKRRVWRAATESHQWEPSDFGGDDDAETALGWLQRDYSRHLGERYERWLDVEAGWPDTWRDAMGMDDSWVVATPEQARAMRDELDEVVARYRRVGQGNPSARRVAIYAVMYPIDLDRPPRGEDRR